MQIDHFCLCSSCGKQEETLCAGSEENFQTPQRQQDPDEKLSVYRYGSN